MILSYLELQHVCKSYQKPILADINLKIDKGQLVCFLGSSGCGKTTLLRTIAGLEVPDSGNIWFNQENITFKEVHKRRIGMMFQDYALFPHQNVRENIEFGLRVQKWTKDKQKERVNELLHFLEIENLANRSVQTLSGGEKQRVALARSLAPNPQLLLLDEPLASLDKGLREQLVGTLRKVLKHYQMTTLFVTHDQVEAMQFADSIAILNNGAIEQYGTPEQLYYQPASDMVAGFLGFKNRLSGILHSNGLLETDIGYFTGVASSLYLRPESAVVIDTSHQAYLSEPRVNVLTGTVIEKRFIGRAYWVEIEEIKTAKRFYFELMANVPEVSQKIHLFFGITS